MQPDIQLLALFCGHFLGDFVFQSDRLVALKSKHRKWMVFHVLQVSLLSWILLGNIAAWWVVVILFCLHLLVDYIKIWANRKILPNIKKDQIGAVSTVQSDEDVEGNQSAEGLEFRWFIGDQLLHMCTLLLLWYCLIIFNVPSFQENRWDMLLGDNYRKGIILLTGLAIGVSGIGVVLKYQMAEFAVKLGGHIRDGLPRGGQTIGILERLLVFMFVLAGKPEGVGFVIAAKSVFRIGELTDREEKNHAEYIMIGTLRSFTYALAIAFITSWLINHV